MSYDKKSLEIHKKLKGKICISSKKKIKTKEDISILYTPGVGAVSRAIGEDLSKSWQYTNRANQVAIVCDGTAVLGLGNIGPEAGMPVMEGKSVIFKEMAGIDAIPLCINAKETDEIVKFCKQIEPSFAGINLEDISAPRCFEILERLEKESNIAVFHDDQDGTAIVVLAGLINACQVTKKEFKNLRVVINGSGAAGIAITRLLLAKGFKDICLIDRIGTIYKGRPKMNAFKKKISLLTNKNKVKGRLEEAMVGADVLIGVSIGNLVNEEMIKTMNPNPIIFALANPTPEVYPDVALKAGASIVATGRSDFPNQINNALVFPGLFKGLLESGQKKVTVEMKIAAAAAIATLCKPTKNNLLPSILDKRVAKAVARAIKSLMIP